jgi:hypothetical protein
MHYCEAELCAWVEQPANTWSNLAYLFIGGWLIHRALRDGRRDLSVIGIIEVLIGLGSFFFHMSSTHVGEVVDVGFMYLLVGYVGVVNLHRFLVKVRGHGLSFARQMSSFAAIVVASIAALVVFKGDIGVVIFALLAVGAGHLETRMWRTMRDPVSYKPLRNLLLTFSLAWAIWWLDLLKIGCNPENHFVQGHAIWHLLNAFVFVFLYQFYRQFPAAMLSPSGGKG